MKKILKQIVKGIRCIIDLDFITVPFAVSYYRVEVDKYIFIGYAAYYIFGIRIMMIQQTKPWKGEYDA